MPTGDRFPSSLRTGYSSLRCSYGCLSIRCYKYESNSDPPALTLRFLLSNSAWFRCAVNIEIGTESPWVTPLGSEIRSVEDRDSRGSIGEEINIARNLLSRCRRA